MHSLCLENQYIKTQEQLDIYLLAIKESKILAIDTEFMRRRTLYPELALIQVYDGKNLALIDPCYELDLSKFWLILSDESILKVLHSPSEDLEVFMKHGQCVPKPLFDTQFAMGLLGFGNSVGFAMMVNKLLSLEIDKSESRTNWLQRPLTQRQLDYAAGDVLHLLPCFEIIKKQIDDKNWLDIILSESALMAKKRQYQVPDEKLYLEIKNAWQLNSSDLAVLKELAVWRRDKARIKNLALGFILKEHNMIEIAKSKPASITALRKLPGIEVMTVNKSGKEILKCIEKFTLLEKEHYPQKIVRLVDYPSYKTEVKLIKHRIDAVAKTQGIPTEVISSKKQINQLLSWHWKCDKEQKKKKLTPDLLSCWRYKILKGKLIEWE
ncbi:ribonuclease D [Pseudoalteromonas sp. NBT06-2]|uniref:ribonuclease D n=1 Tax=Pseudoalteromonas sp. NBT06-2 TaxID=2025950 RepID=UPI000BA7A261|nr:ribonuclease D [Pseudoalteromonas sp. NBT06-2]PAJ76334.1 ribonuclease D [Pseudoalteromonas sp. NBT06-2]